MTDEQKNYIESLRSLRAFVERIATAIYYDDKDKWPNEYHRYIGALDLAVFLELRKEGLV